ncbi:TPA: hypothetical protein QIM62_004809 [Klebsiella aerogenes]|nr:hypothetical protein [Klebsiella aerogenes]
MKDDMGKAHEIPIKYLKEALSFRRGVIKKNINLRITEDLLISLNEMAVKHNINRNALITIAISIMITEFS